MVATLYGSQGDITHDSYSHMITDAVETMGVPDCCLLPQT